MTIVIVLLLLVFLTGCTQGIPDVKSSDYVGKKVMVSGTVESTIKIGKLSGYTLADDEGNKIGVSSENLPKEGGKIIVKGTLMKDTLLGYYILAE